MICVLWIQRSAELLPYFSQPTCAVLHVHGSLLALSLPDARVSVGLKWSPVTKHLLWLMNTFFRRFTLFICSSKRNKKCIIKVQRMENVKIQQGRRVGGWSSNLSIYQSD